MGNYRLQIHRCEPPLDVEDLSGLLRRIDCKASRKKQRKKEAGGTIAGLSGPAKSPESSEGVVGEHSARSVSTNFLAFRSCMCARSVYSSGRLAAADYQMRTSA